MTKLDLHHFRQFCDTHSRQELWVSVESYILRDWAALYHISNIRERLETGKRPQSSYIQKISKIEKELLFETDALMLTLNSMFGLALQIVNQAFISPPIAQEYLKWKNLEKHPDFPPNIRGYIQPFWNHPTCQKIRDYSNISKHIRAIHGQLTIDFRQDVSQTDYTTVKFGSKQFTLNVGDLEDCRKFTKEMLEGLISLVEATLLI